MTNEAKSAFVVPISALLTCLRGGLYSKRRAPLKPAPAFRAEHSFPEAGKSSWLFALLALVLGASRRQLYRRLLGRGMAPALAGVTLGVFGGAFFARSAADLLYRVSPLDAPTFAFAVLVLLGVALLGATSRYAAR